MVPPASHKVSRVSWYSGSCQPLINFAYGIFTLSDQISQNCSAIDSSTLCSPQPRGARTTVWALSISLAATLEIEVSFFSSGYLDVSVPPVPFHTLWIGVWILEVCSSGFPHSEISGSKDICSSPKLIAACHVLLRLLMPRHSPCALYSLTFRRCGLHILRCNASVSSHPFRHISSSRHKRLRWFVTRVRRGTALASFSTSSKRFWFS